MTLDISQVATLVSAQKTTTPNVYDLVTGDNERSIASASLSGLLTEGVASNLTDSQVTSLSTLESFITDNVNESEQGVLFESLASLQGLLELNNTASGQLDPIFALITSNEGLTQSFNLASLLDVQA